MTLCPVRLRLPARGVFRFGCALGLAAGGSCPGQTVREYLLRPDIAPAKDAPAEEMIYIPTKLDDAGFNRVITKVSRPTVMVYRPVPSAETDGTAMVVCPGGGYASLVIDREGYAIGRYFQQRGRTGVGL